MPKNFFTAAVNKSEIKKNLTNHVRHFAIHLKFGIKIEIFVHLFFLI